MKDCNVQRTNLWERQLQSLQKVKLRWKTELVQPSQQLVSEQFCSLHVTWCMQCTFVQLFSPKRRVAKKKKVERNIRSAEGLGVVKSNQVVMLHVRWLFALWSDWMTCLENQKKDVNQSNLLEIDNCRICAVLCSTLSSRTRHRLFNRCIVAISFSERVCQCYNPLSADKHRNTRRTLAKVSTPMFPVAIPATEKDPIKNHLRRKVVKTLTWMVSYR